MLSDTVFERVGDEEMATLPPASHASCERDDDRIRCEGNTGNANYVRMRKLTFEAPDDSSNTSADAESIHKRRPFTQPLNKWQTKHFAKDLTNLFPDSRAPSLASEARSKSRPFPPQTESAAKPEAAAGSIEATSFNHARVLHLNPASPSTPDHSPQSPSPTAASPGGEPASRDAYCARPASTPQSLLRQPRRRFNEDTPSPRTPPSGVFAPVAITPSPLRVSCDGSPVKITQIETPRALLSPAESFDATPPPRQFTSNHTFAEVPFEAAQKLDEVFTNLLTGRVGHWGARDEIDATLTACGGVGKFDLTPWLRLASIDFSRFVRASLKGKAHAACDELADHDDRSIVTPGGASVDTTDTTLEQPTCRGFDFFSATAAGSPIAKTLARSSLRLSDRRGVEPVHVSLLAVDEASSSESEGTQVPDACYCDELEGEGVCEHCWALEHDRRTLPDENGSAFDSNEADDEEGEEVEVLSQRGHWYQVECARGVYFYNGKSCVSQWEPEGTPFESARGNDRSRAFPTTDDRCGFRSYKLALETRKRTLAACVGED
ncbi:hypothetical protein DIPPA_04588 [Diplonema papillatum]|nr:hypothetical protein DIPPA_04588 [Diplonema papillatum]